MTSSIRGIPHTTHSGKPNPIFAAPSLEPILSTTTPEWKRHDLQLMFVHDHESVAATPGCVMLVPAFTPSQSAALTKLLDNFPLTIAIGVVRDTTGLQTHNAITAGAAYVANLHLTWDLLLGDLAPAIMNLRKATTCPSSPPPQSSLWSLGDTHRGQTWADENEPPRPEPPRLIPNPTTAAHQRTLVSALDACQLDRLAPEDLEVVKLLQEEGLSIREIAARLYVSQRSLYRRLRRIYTHLGVTTRRELEDVVADI